MELKTLNPNLMVANVNQSVAFYIENLGFELVQIFSDKSQPQWAIIKSGEIILMFHQAEKFKVEYPIFENMAIGGSFTLYIQGTDISVLYAQIHQKVNVVKKLIQTDYGTLEFAIQDLDGYVLAFSEVIL